MTMRVANEGLQNIFELHKQRNNTNEAKRGQTCPKKPEKKHQTLLVPNFISSYF